MYCIAYFTVSGQNTIGKELTLLSFIQHTVNEHYITYFNWLLKLHPAVMLQDCRIIAGCNSTNQLLHTVFCFLQPAVVLPINWLIDWLIDLYIILIIFSRLDEIQQCESTSYFFFCPLTVYLLPSSSKLAWEYGGIAVGLQQHLKHGIRLYQGQAEVLNISETSLGKQE